MRKTKNVRVTVLIQALAFEKSGISYFLMIFHRIFINDGKKIKKTVSEPLERS